ncbi:MAG: BsuBI/PstI family type II restriction endonuclease [Anaerolineaceae bacterium]|nr:BsuBI/PstI family type II restriction endonuclease [Anaerolineaceae bacterium]
MTLAGLIPLHEKRDFRLSNGLVTASNLSQLLDIERLELSNRLSENPKKRAALGQYFTPENVACFMAGMLRGERLPDTLHVLDAGGGSGILTGAVVAEFCSRPEYDRPKRLSATVWEIDERFASIISRTFSLCREVCRKAGIEFAGELCQGNFVLEGSDLIDGNSLFARERNPCFDIAILNPPYRKLASGSKERSRLRSVGIETSNLYAAFVWLSLKLLKDCGQLVAITPRSFMNGSYFRPFRQALYRDLAFQHVHVYETRNTAFASDDVLQETVIFHGIRSGQRTEVKITTSASPADSGNAERIVDPDELIRPNDKEYIFHLVSDETDARVAQVLNGLDYRLEDLGVHVSTGRVVSFRARDRLRAHARADDVPLIYPQHFADGFVSWPAKPGNKPNAIARKDANDDLYLPNGWYVLVKRFSAREDKRRVMAAVFDPSLVDSEFVTFDNKLNVLHRQNAGLSMGLAKGLAAFLNSTAVDMYFRQFSGHTQVNAADLRSMCFPGLDELEYLGRFVQEKFPPEGKLNHLVEEAVPSMEEARYSIEAREKIRAAEEILRDLQAPRGQRNKRSALTLLGLLDLSPEQSWSDAEAPLRGVTQLMDWMREVYGKNYQPNTRETIRRFTLHQFIEMGLVIPNPDDRERPPNSPRNVYQIEQSALKLIRLFGTEGWPQALDTYLNSVKSKNRLRDRKRGMERIPVTLPDGRQIELSAGGQNVLVKEIVEQFAPRFTPDGVLVYLGDSEEKHKHYEIEYLRSLGVEIDPHGRMPDVAIHYTEQSWLVIVEAVTSHGPANALRHNQLRDLFVGSKAGLVFVTAFLNRSTMREYLPDIDWETEVWVADAPDHLIHFAGERFLGPYESS